MIRALAALILAFGLTAGPALAVLPHEILPDQALEQRARALSKELRCMVCQNESIDESNAPLARDLRVLVRERLVAGDSDRQVLDFLVARYGDFVLLRPPLRPETVLLWAAPVLAVLLGVAGLYAAWRRRAEQPAVETAVAPLSADEEARVQALLSGLPKVNETDRRG